MATQNAQVSLPEKVVLNGVEFSVKDYPELQQFMQDVSKVEKNKLYSQFDSLKAQIAQLGNVQITTPQQQVAEPQAPMGITQESLKALIQETINQSIQPLMANDEVRQKMLVEEYRQKLINENSDNCFIELVKGNTKEELDKSLADSIALRAKYQPKEATPQAPTATPQATPQPQEPQPSAQAAPQAPVAPQAPQAPQMPFVPQGQPSSVVPPLPQVPQVPAPQPGGTLDIKTMSPQEFAEKRDALYAQLQAMVK